jgi:cytochrome b subunit of formate dehydrogenase
MPLGFPAAVYILCFLTSGACAYLLARNYRRTGTRLLMWSALCFGFLALNNGVVFIDALVLPEVDLAVMRLSLSLAAVTVLLFGFVWEAEQ